MTKKNAEQNLIYPFTSDKFLESWDLWKKYKKETFGFVYKGVYSEQMTLKKLTELSNGEEERAIRIIEQSIMQQWQGLFPLHIPKFKENGESKSTRKPSSTNKGDIRSEVQAELNRSNGSWQSAAGSNGSKGV